MRRQRPLALLAVVTLAAGMAACGSDDELSAPVPKTSPDLTIPTGTTDAPPDAADTDTTSTTSTSTSTTQAVTPPAAPPADATPQAPAGTPTTGGATPPAAQGTNGGAQAGGGEFEDFCAQNPGAC